MKTTIWTSWGMSNFREAVSPKCIFNGDLSFIPRKGDEIQIKEGYSLEHVSNVSYSIPRNCIEIHVETSDYNNDYKEVAV